MKADYHMHSRVSDGVLSPTQIVERAAANGVKRIALTDHDNIEGLEEARVATRQHHMELISGVEISTTWHHKTIHILGYGFRMDDPHFDKKLASMRATRSQRAKKIAEKLSDLGFPNTLEGAQKLAGRKTALARPHFARELVRQGHCKNFTEAMVRYLADGKPASVSHTWITIHEAVNWIRDAGGYAFIAHPLRYKMNDSTLTLQDLIDTFQQAGGTGIEVVYKNLGQQETDYIADITRRRGLAASRGSDFHVISEGVDIGNIPELPSSLISLEQVLGLS